MSTWPSPLIATNLVQDTPQFFQHPRDHSMNYGFTGTKYGMNYVQQNNLRELLYSVFSDGSEFHHGDCVGADSEAAAIAWRVGFRIVCHPPIKPGKRAWTTFNDRILDPKPYLDRDRDIVQAGDALIAAPHTPYEIRRSGTWTTVRYARKLKRPIYLILPDGMVQIENIAQEGTNEPTIN